MPTVYTSNLYDGKDESFTDFVLQCARGMGAFITQRDESMNVKPRMRRIETYYVDSLARDREAMRKWQNASDDDKYDQWRDYVDETEARNAERKAKNDALRVRYNTRLAQIQAWNCPDTLISLRDFMIQQVEQSIKFDCYEYNASVMEYEEWVDFHSESVVGSVSRSEKSLNEAIERVRKQNEYTATLYATLGIDYQE